jgi:hypothetical protein
VNLGGVSKIEELFDLGGGLRELLPRGGLEADSGLARRSQTERGLKGDLSTWQPEETVEIWLGRFGPTQQDV